MKIEIQADKIKINFTENDQTKSIEVEYVLGATGRQSNIDHLGLQSAKFHIQGHQKPSYR